MTRSRRLFAGAALAFAAVLAKAVPSQAASGGVYAVGGGAWTYFYDANPQDLMVVTDMARDGHGGCGVDRGPAG